MAKYALVDDSDTVRDVKDERRVDLTAGTRAGWRWLIVNDVVTDNSTSPDKVPEPVVETVLANEVRRLRVIRDMTAQEISDRDDVIVASEVDRVLGKALFIIENRLRGLEGRQTVTKNQFLNWLKANL